MTLNATTSHTVGPYYHIGLTWLNREDLTKPATLGERVAISGQVADGKGEVVNDAMQIHGGYGYSSEFPLERMLRDVRALQLGGGTNEILKNRIAGELLRMPAEG